MNFIVDAKYTNKKTEIVAFKSEKYISKSNEKSHTPKNEIINN